MKVKCEMHRPGSDDINYSFDLVRLRDNKLIILLIWSDRTSKVWKIVNCYFEVWSGQMTFVKKKNADISWIGCDKCARYMIIFSCLFCNILDENQNTYIFTKIFTKKKFCILFRSLPGFRTEFSHFRFAYYHFSFRRIPITNRNAH